MQDIHPGAAPAAASFTDRSDRLMAMGIIQIILGSISGLLVLLTAAVHCSGKLPRTGAYQTSSTTFTSVATMILVTIFFIWSGIGAIKKKRWVRPLMLSTMWPALLIGTTVLFVMAFVMPQAFDEMTGPGGRAIPERARDIATTVVLVIMAVVYIIIPLLHIILYTNPEVQRTCEKYDPEPRWTDACPIPVLALAIWLGTAAIFIVLVGLATPVLPVFGTLVTGIPATLGNLVMGGILGYLAYAAYRMRPAGLWGTLVLLVVAITSVMVTYFSVGAIEWIRATGTIRPEDARYVEPIAAVMLGPLLMVSVFWGLMIVAYLLYLWRFFREA